MNSTQARMKAVHKSPCLGEVPLLFTTSLGVALSALFISLFTALTSQDTVCFQEHI